MNNSLINRRVVRASIAILNYLRDYPQAVDTVKGIAQWWVGEDQEAVEKALALLVREGAVVQRGKTYRRASKEKFSDDDHKKILQSFKQLD